MPYQPRWKQLLRQRRLVSQTPLQSPRKMFTIRFLLILVMGGFLGLSGSAMAQAAGYPEFQNLFSGILGAIGGFAFDALTSVGGLAMPRRFSRRLQYFG